MFVARHFRFRITHCLLALLASATGCSTLSSLGLPVTSGPYQLSDSAEAFRNAAGHPVTLPRELAKSVVPEYRVEPGDVLVVEPTRFDSTIRLPSDQPVQPDGTIEIGRFGRAFVAGKTTSEIEIQVQALIDGQLRAESEKALDDPLDEPSDSTISVRLLNKESKVFYVIGEVNAPGTYPLVGRETILDAIMTAGGVTAQANEHKLIFVRPTAPDDCRVVLPVCYRQIVQIGDTSTNYQLMPGDRIYVPSMTLHDDIAQLLRLGADSRCPRCEPIQRPCVVTDCRSNGSGTGSACAGDTGTGVRVAAENFAAKRRPGPSVARQQTTLARQFKRQVSSGQR